MRIASASIGTVRIRKRNGDRLSQTLRLRSWKSLLFKVQHLSLEVEDRLELIREFTPEFERRVMREMGEAPAPEAPIQPESDEPGLVKAQAEPHGEAPANPDPPESDQTKKVPDSVRRLWRSIAVATHPDKVGSDGELGVLYRRASAAWSEGDYATLVGVALDLGVAIEPDESLAAALRQIAEEHERKLSNLEQMAIWQWLQASAEKKAAVVRATSDILKSRR